MHWHLFELFGPLKAARGDRSRPSFNAQLPEQINDRRDQHEDEPNRYGKPQPDAEFSSALC